MEIYPFLGTVVLISLSGVLMPGPLFAITIQKAAKSQIAGVLIGLGHGVVEIPLMFLTYFLISRFAIPSWVQVAIGVIGGSFMMLMGVNAYKNRNRQKQTSVNVKRDSFLTGIWITAFNAGFILWWLTIGMNLILMSQQFGLTGFSIFAGLHWSIDFVWYALVGLLIFKSQKFWNTKIHQGVTLFCVGVFLIFGVYFIGSALMSLIAI